MHNETRKAAEQNMFMTTVYRDSMDHLTDELRRIDLLLERAIARFRGSRKQGSFDELRGLYLSEEEIDGLFSSRMDEVDQHDDSDTAIAALCTSIRERVLKSRNAGLYLRLPSLASTFGLSDFEVDILMLALAPELDRRYQKFYSYLHDDVTRKRPTVGLALQLFCSNQQERIRGRKAFSEDSALQALALITLHDDPSERAAPLINRFIKLDERIVDFLLGDDRPDSRIAGLGAAMRRITPRLDLPALILPENTRMFATRFANLAVRSASWICCLHGPKGVGKKTIAEAICKTLNKSLLVVDLPSTASNDTTLGTIVRSALREARLYGSAVYFDCGQDVNANEPDRTPVPHNILQEAKRFPGLVFIGSRVRWLPDKQLASRFISLELQAPNEDQRREIWTRMLNDSVCGVATEINPASLASSFRFTAGQIQESIMAAEQNTHLLHDRQLGTEAILASCREQAAQHLVSFAKHVVPKRSWDDLVLPKDTLAQLREFCQQVRCRAKVYDAWGFGNRLSLGKGLLALFTGPSGTGKTLTAEIMANALGLGLYKVDLSCVVSKYIGETEKNLSRVFQDAQDSNAILLFDEADALFGKRSEVKDAHDRYANIEINYLLQRVEEYEGVIILSSNMSNNIDSAFLRRMQTSIDFPFPDEHNRLRIWRNIFPPETPLAADIDFDFLARKFKIAGGNIKNVALAAAFRAAENGGVVRMEHVILGMKREYQKLDKVCEKSDFERYYELLRRDC